MPRPRQHELESLYREARPELVAVLCTVVRDPALAEDLAQEAGLRLFRGADAQARDHRALLFAIAMNLARDHLRHVRVRDAHLEASRHEAERIHESAESAHEAALGLERIGRMFALLPPRLRRVMWLSRVEGFTNAEVAARLGVSVKAVEKQLSRGLDKLTAWLNPPRVTRRRGAGGEP
jgi:RNA polymerase sigma factor (sigma-70 family)